MKYKVQSPDGTVHTIEGPDGATNEEVIAQAQRLLSGPSIKQKIESDPIHQDALKGGAGQSGYLNTLGGMVRGAGSIGATLMRPFESGQENSERRGKIDAALGDLIGSDKESFGYGAGKLGTEIAGTMGAGGLLAKPLQALAGTRAAAGLEPLIEGGVKALQTGGFRVGPLAGTGAGTAARLGAGAVLGGASAGMIDPSTAGTGALIGAALPAGVAAGGAAGRFLAQRIGQGNVSPEVAALANRAEQLGIKVPADRLLNSRPLNAVASALNYVPFSGRSATEDAMNSQLNQALSKTFGQNSSNVTMALRKAETDLGSKFDSVLKNNGVNFDNQLLTEVSSVFNRAEKELGSDALKPIASQIDELFAKGANGTIDGQAAYNIKRTLDRIGKQNTPEAWHANELKKVLMSALNRSLGPDEAAAFAQVRKQYGNMLDLQNLAKSGVDGEISAARLANKTNIGNKDVQELADIAAQFVKPREGQHGAAQRAAAGLLTLGYAGPGTLALGAGTGRAVNATLNSTALRNSLLNRQAQITEPEIGLLSQAFARSAPTLLSGQSRP